MFGTERFSSTLLTLVMLSSSAAIAGTVQSGDPLAIELQAGFRAAQPITSIEQIKNLLDVDLYCAGAEVKSDELLSRGSGDARIAAWIKLSDLGGGSVRSSHRSERGSWQDAIESFRGGVGLTGFASSGVGKIMVVRRLGSDHFLWAENDTMDTSRVSSSPSEDFSMSVITGQYQAHAYYKCYIPDLTAEPLPDGHLRPKEFSTSEERAPIAVPKPQAPTAVPKTQAPVVIPKPGTAEVRLHVPARIPEVSSRPAETSAPAHPKATVSAPAPKPQHKSKPKRAEASGSY